MLWSGMGSILQEQVTFGCVDRVSIRESEWKKKASWSGSRAVVTSNRMVKRQSQRKPAQAQSALPAHENINEKRLQRRKHRPNSPVTKRNTRQSSSDPAPPSGSKLEPKVQAAAQHCGLRECKHTAVSSGHRPSSLQVGGVASHAQEDSDTDLSETERCPVSFCARGSPQLQLRPEVIEAEEVSCHRVRGRGHGTFDFPDFLPPPFNSWSLSQLAIFYNMEGRAAPRPRPMGLLERFLERVLQLEWDQIQTIKEESGKSAVSEVTSGCHRSASAASLRLSSPKCILQCQRAFPLSFLSSLTSHSTLLSSYACTPCRIHPSAHSHSHPSRLSPMLERSRRPPSLPRRSYSESRVQSSDRCCRGPRLSSPARTSSYLKRMQASGNIRRPISDAPSGPHSTVRDPAEPAGRAGALDSGEGVLRKRSGSEQRTGGAQRQQNRSEKRRSGSEYRKGRGERRRASDFKEQEVKPDAVTAILDNLPASKYPPVQRQSGLKQVEFVT